MTVDTVFQALREANPVPHPPAYAGYRVQAAAFLTATEQRSEQMTTREDEKKLQQDRNARRGRPVFAIAAFVAIVAVGIAVWIGIHGSDDMATIPAPPFESGEEAIEAYIAAVQAGDYAAFMGLFSFLGADAWYGRTEEGIREGILFDSALYTPGAAPPPEVTCNSDRMSPYNYVCDVFWVFDPIGWKLDESVTDDPSRLRRGASRTVELGLTVDGRINYFYWNWAEGLLPDAELDANADAFDAWMEIEHPELVLPQDTLPSDPVEFARGLESAVDEFIAQAEG